MSSALLGGAAMISPGPRKLPWLSARRKCVPPYVPRQSPASHIENPMCDAGLCLGTYGGTHFRLADNQGNFLGPGEIIAAPPNSADDIAVFPNGDLGWAFVAEDRSYSSPLTTLSGVPAVPAVRQVSVARLA